MKMYKKIESITFKRMIDDNPMLDYLGKFSDEKEEFAIEHNGGRNSYKYFNAENVENMKQAKENYNRIMKYNSGELWDWGIKVEAEIQTSYNKKDWIINKISSGGLWGISSDTEEEYIKDEEKNQLEELKDVLFLLGFTKKDIKQAKLNYYTD